MLILALRNLNVLSTAALSKQRLHQFCVALLVVLCVSCATGPDPSGLPGRLLQQTDFTYAGGFILPADTFGSSSTNWSQGIIEVSDGSLFIMGNEQEDAIAQFRLPDVETTISSATLTAARPPIQVFSDVFTRLSSNPDNLDQVLGLEMQDDRLVVNAIEYYDAPADNRLTTLVINDSDNLAGTSVSGPYAMRGRARVAGWLSEVPAEWQAALGCTHISGASSGHPIIARLSVGPSAFCVNLSDLITEPDNKTVDTRELLGYSLQFPLHRDLLNESGSNDVWTHISQATFGFIVPGTSTYATFGNSGGHAGGVGYKLERANGIACPGYCAQSPADQTSFYWLWDVRELLNVVNSRKAPSQVKPYAWGEWKLPFDVPDNARLGGASYDATTGVLYLTLLNVYSSLQPGKNPPIVLKYRIAS
ncbi:MAG: hypothetical protein AAF404_04420 [Pseudomonadota bacterium]